MTARSVELTGGAPWGFRMHGGSDTNQPLRISRVNPGRKAALSGIREGDVISTINSVSTKNITNAQAHAMLKNAGDSLKLGLNEDLSSPRRKGSVKSNQTELKRPSQIIAEVQTRPTPKLVDTSSGPFSFQQKNNDIPPITSQPTQSIYYNQPTHLSTIIVTVENHAQRLPSPSKPGQISEYTSIYSYPSKSPVRHVDTLTDPLKSPSMLTSPSRQRQSPSQQKTSPFSPLESTSLVKSSIQPSITMPTITPPTFSYPNSSSTEYLNSDRLKSSQNIMKSSTSPFSSTNQFPKAPICTPARYSPTYNIETTRLSPKSPFESAALSPVYSKTSPIRSQPSPIRSQPSLNRSQPSVFNPNPSPRQTQIPIQNNNATHSQIGASGQTDVLHSQTSPYYYSVAPHLQNGTSVSQSNIFKQSQQIHPSYTAEDPVTSSQYFPFNTNTSSSSSNIFHSITTCSSYLSASKPITSKATHSPSHIGLQGQSSPFGTHISSAPNSLPPVVSHTVAIPKSSLSSMQLPHYLLYSTPTTTKSTNPFITKEYLMTKTEISEESITETQEITTTKKMSLNGYEEPSASAFDKALSSLKINGPYNNGKYN